jgi:thioredoxin reductase (NADPH)
VYGRREGKSKATAYDDAMSWTDVAIVGGGPIGIELAVALKRAEISHIQFESKQEGQTMYWWPPGTRWFSSSERIAIAGVPLQTIDQGKATREDYLRYLRTMVEEFDLEVRTFEPVVAVERPGEGFVVRTKPTGGEKEYRARNVVLATGGTARPRRLRVPGEDLPHVNHYMEDPHRYFRRRVLVVGGKNSAVEAALRIYNVGAEVTLSYRRSEFNAKSIKYWLFPEIMGLIRNGKIRAHFNTVVTRIEGEEVELARCEEGGLFSGERQKFMVKADDVLLMVGYVADMSLARAAGVTLTGENEVPAFSEQTMETNIPGLFIAGTVVAGTQGRYQVFLENCHAHVERIVARLKGERPPQGREIVGTPES